MPRAFGFDGDSAYHESLEAAVRASEAKKREEKENAEKERRATLGLPEEGTLHAKHFVHSRNPQHLHFPCCG